MARRITWLTSALALLLCLPLPVLAQDGPELNVQCLTLAGEVPTEGSIEFGLEDAIGDGSVSVESVAPSNDCGTPPDGARCVTIAGSAPADGWQPASLTEAIGSRRANVVLVAAPEECAQVVADTFGTSGPVESVDPAEVAEPLDVAERPELEPLQVLDFGFRQGEFSSTFVALVVNPNPETWAASSLPANVRVMDGQGNELESVSSYATLLPGEVGAIVGFLTTSKKPAGLDIEFEGADWNWVSTDLSADALVVTKVKRPKDAALGFKTTGRFRNDNAAALENVTLVAVHRNEAGDIIGSDFTLVASIGPREAKGFEIPNLSGVPRKRVAETQVYVSLTSIP